MFQNISPSTSPLQQVWFLLSAVCNEEDALRNEVQDLHEQVLKYEVEQGGMLRDLTAARDTIQSLEHKINVRCVDWDIYTSY